MLRGKCGFSEMHRVVPGEILERGDGLEIIQSITATAFADLVDALVKQWMEPVPVVEPYLVEAAVMEWRKQQDRLRKLGRLIVDDPTVSLQSVESLLGGCTTMVPILRHLKLEHGTKLTASAILSRIAVDSGSWLALQNVSTPVGSGRLQRF